jgi:glyoxylase-like metal-dependent hydrolase (beta-lactamase superfamily II)
MTDISTTNPPWIATRQVGDAEITIISEGGLLWSPGFAVPEETWRAVLPEADEQGRLWIGLNVAIVRLGDALVVIDPGLDDPDSQWQRDLATVWPDWPTRRTPGLKVALAQLGIDATDVTHVIITHPHGDHYAGVAFERDGGIAARFPNARHFIGREDWAGNPARQETGTALERLEMIDRLGLLELVDEPREIAPGITIRPAPGETPGHCLVEVDSSDERFLFLGDLVHLSCEVEHRAWMPPNANAATLAPTRDRIFAEAAATDPLLATAHEHFPPWGRIMRNGAGFQWVRV